MRGGDPGSIAAVRLRSDLSPHVRVDPARKAFVLHYGRFSPRARWRKEMLIAKVNATKGGAFTLTNRKVAFTSANDFGQLLRPSETLEAESDTHPQAIDSNRGVCVCLFIHTFKGSIACRKKERRNTLCCGADAFITF